MRPGSPSPCTESFGISAGDASAHSLYRIPSVALLRELTASCARARFTILGDAREEAPHVFCSVSAVLRELRFLYSDTTVPGAAPLERIRGLRPRNLSRRAHGSDRPCLLCPSSVPHVLVASTAPALRPPVPTGPMYRVCVRVGPASLRCPRPAYSREKPTPGRISP